MRIALFVPCFVDVLAPQVGRGMVRVLERLGHALTYPGGQTCCGQPAYSAGRWDEARAVARHFIEVFGPAARAADAIVCPSASCAAMVRRGYAELLAGRPELPESGSIGTRVFELCEFLVRRLGVTDVGAAFSGKVAWHDGCHGLRELGLREEPRRLLRAVRGLDLREAEGADACCGFGGTFSVAFPWISTAMAEAKVAGIEAAGAEIVASADSTCLMQLGGLLARRGSKIRTLHIAEILALDEGGGA